MQHPSSQTQFKQRHGQLMLRDTIAAYRNEIAARKSQLLDDLSIYQGKLSDLKRLDPLDFTGLQYLYTAHVRHIENLLCEFDGPVSEVDDPTLASMP